MIVDKQFCGYKIKKDRYLVVVAAGVLETFGGGEKILFRHTSCKYLQVEDPAKVVNSRLLIIFPPPRELGSSAHLK